MGGGQRLSAGRLCGAVRLVLDGPPLGVGLCHCTTCRKETGAPFKHVAVVLRSAVTITGETRSWAAPSGALRHVCPSCGSRLFANDRDGPEIEVGSLDGTSLLPPTTEGFAGRREAWLPEFGLARYPGSASEDA